MKLSKIFYAIFILMLFINKKSVSQFVNPPALSATNSGVALTINGLYIGARNGFSNTALGQDAMSATTIPSDNLAIGYRALMNGVNNPSNTAIGNRAMESATGNNNTCVGGGSGFNMTGNLNTCFGAATLQNSSGLQNVVLGYGSMQNSTSGNNNTALGYGALIGLQVGGTNTGVGNGALFNLAYGNNNVAIGSGASVLGAPGLSGTPVDNKLSIQNVIHGINMNSWSAAGISIGIFGGPGPTTVAGVMPIGTLAKLHLGGNGSAPPLQLDNVPNGTSLGKYLFVDATGIVAQAPMPSGLTGINSCAIVGTIPVTSNVNGNMSCSIVNQVSGNIGIDVPTPLSKLDINCTASSSNGHIRLRNLAQWPTTNPNTNFLLIDANGDVWKSNGQLSKGQVGSPTIDIDQNEVIQEQQTAIDQQKIKIANLETEVSELKIKINQLMPGNVIVKDNNFQITPNPVTGTSTISYKMDASITNAVFIVYDLQGKMIRKYSVDKNAKEGQVQISKKDFGNGMYILSLVANNQEIQSKHFIISE